MRNLFKTKKLSYFWSLSLAAATIVSCTTEEELTTSLDSTNEVFATPEAGNAYYIQNKNSDRYMAIEDASNSNAANLYQLGQSASSSDTHKQWEVVDLNNGYYRLKGVDSGKSLTVQGGSNSDGSNVEQEAYSGVTHQQWEIISTGDGYFRIKSVDSGKCMNVESAGKSDGDNIEIKAWNGDDKFQWFFTKVSGNEIEEPVDEVVEEEEEEEEEE